MLGLLGLGLTCSSLREAVIALASASSSSILAGPGGGGALEEVGGALELEADCDSPFNEAAIARANASSSD